MGSPTEGDDARHQSAVAKHRARGSKSDSIVVGGHKRSTSGSLLARLPFLRPSEDDDSPDIVPIHPAHNAPSLSPPSEANASSRTSSAMAAIVYQTKGRKRKGSLRKTAILGTGKLHLDTRNTAPLSHKKSPSLRHSMDSPRNLSNTSPPARFSIGIPSAESSSEGLPIFKHTSSTEPDDLSEVRDFQQYKLDTPLASPTGTYGSTDDDELLSMPGPAAPSDLLLHPLAVKPSAAAAQSYFADVSPPARRRSSTKTSFPLAVPEYPLHGADGEWDYSYTAQWGWVVLISTWLVFVIGMGSCFSVWSWAWDVGETPYAPPELEDDPTLPIVGYYPALLVLTAVMAWVWVIVAWVGMKYFKHAKMAGEEG